MQLSSMTKKPSLPHFIMTDNYIYSKTILLDSYQIALNVPFVENDLNMLTFTPENKYSPCKHKDIL